MKGTAGRPLLRRDITGNNRESGNIVGPNGTVRRRQYVSSLQNNKNKEHGLGFLSPPPPNSSLAVPAAALNDFVREVDPKEKADFDKKVVMLIDLLAHSPDHHVKTRATQELTKIGEKDAYYTIGPLAGLIGTTPFYVQLFALALIDKLACDGPEHRHKLFKSGVLIKVVDLMRGSDLQVQGTAATLLTHMAGQHCENADLVTESGALEPLCDLVKSRDTFVRGQAIAAMCCLTETNKDTRVVAAARGCAEPLIMTLAEVNDRGLLDNGGVEFTATEAGIPCCAAMVLARLGLRDQKVQSKTAESKALKTLRFLLKLPRRQEYFGLACRGFVEVSAYTELCRKSLMNKIAHVEKLSATLMQQEDGLDLEGLSPVKNKSKKNGKKKGVVVEKETTSEVEVEDTPLEARNLDDELLCPTCKLDDKTAILLPCFHVAACEQCAVMLIKKKKPCPMCTGRVDGFRCLFG